MAESLGTDPPKEDKILLEEGVIIAAALIAQRFHAKPNSEKNSTSSNFDDASRARNPLIQGDSRFYDVL